MLKLKRETVKKIEELSEALACVRDELTIAASDAEGYFADKSDAWRESNRGSTYTQWADSIRNIADSVDTLRDELDDFNPSFEG